MTRKRFIKLLMSHGISRNEAIKIAYYYNSRNIPYEIAYSKLSLALKIKWTCVVDKLKLCCRALAEEFENFRSAFERAMQKAGENNDK